MKKTSKNQTPKAKSLNPKSKKPKGLKTVGWKDPKYPGFYFFKHERELRWLDTNTLYTVCFNVAISSGMVNPDKVPEFANWACESAIKKINNGNTKNGHLNDATFLLNDWLQLEKGHKNPNSNRALQFKKTVSYDNTINDDGDTFRDLIPDTKSLDPEQEILLKEKLINTFIELKLENVEKKKIIELKRHPKRVIERENRVYQFLLSKTESYCSGIYNQKFLAQECGMELGEFKTTIEKLVEKARVCLVGDIFFLPDEFITDEIA